MKFIYVYGPVYSWRIGPSLGLDPLAQTAKVCTFDCAYCQLGRSVDRTLRRRVYAPTAAIMDEFARLPAVDADFITIAGTGEPTLAKNLGEIIRRLKAVRRERIVVITNGSLLYRRTVRRDLCAADEIMTKLDAADMQVLGAVNHPAAGITWQRIIGGLQAFRREYRGKLALQLMFIRENQAQAAELARLCRTVAADEIQLNTPLRRCECRPLTIAEMGRIKMHFSGLPVISVYEAERRSVIALDEEQTVRRHGK